MATAPLLTARAQRASGVRHILRILWVTATAEFKLKYQDSALGYVWTLMRPLLLFGVLYFVFTEIVRFGDDAGFFLVSQRRGGAMSRVGRDTDGRSWVGVDWARDAFDYGPLQDTPPDYNRLENPAYPVPV